ncbi:MAG TPA: hypothetical protein DCE44_00280 [Verrucomicrobiales bacterium]|nr:hypothetical protein [Verrucomicrobiales bacterium]
MLGVSWLNDELHVCAGDSDTLRMWSAPQPLCDVTALGPALRLAVSQTAFPGREVALVLAHSQLVQSYLEIPPCSTATARRLVERHVERLKSFPGPAVWNAQSAATGTDSRSCIVHMIPRELHDALVRACLQANLNLTVLTPASELVASMVSQSSTSGESVLAAVEIPNGVVLVVNRTNGVPLLRRTITGSWAADFERIIGEVRRTVIFVRQQYQQSVGEIWLGGSGLLEEAIRSLGTAAPAVIRLQPEPTRDGWGCLVRGFRTAEVNLVTREQREARQRRVVSRWGRGLGWLAISSSVGLAVFSQRLREQEWTNRVELGREVARLEHCLVPLRAADQSMRQQRVVIEARECALRPPVQVWLLGGLAHSLPPGIVLTNVGLGRVTNGWQIKVDGWATAESSESPAAIVERFTSAVGQGPLALLLRPRQTASATSPAPVETDVRASWTSRLREDPLQPAGKAQSFSLEGILR